MIECFLLEKKKQWIGQLAKNNNKKEKKETGGKNSK